ncbi:MAG: toxin-antitoxin system HicB family antitoxin [Eubacteriales bacterium]|nr:toxin-antitoxin system HicB family antitoxin [Eubacteriales bacterium]
MNNYECRVFKYGDDWVCEYPDLEGCIGIGATPEEAVSDGEEAKALWLKDYYEDNQSYPESLDTYSKDYSGKFNLRLQPSLHRELAIYAKSEGVSLNALCSQLLAYSLGRKQASNTITVNVKASHNRDEHEKSVSDDSWTTKSLKSEPNIISLVNAS